VNFGISTVTLPGMTLERFKAEGRNAATYAVTMKIVPTLSLKKKMEEYAS